MLFNDYTDALSWHACRARHIVLTLILDLHLTFAPTVTVPVLSTVLQVCNRYPPSVQYQVYTVTTCAFVYSHAFVIYSCTCHSAYFRTCYDAYAISMATRGLPPIKSPIRTGLSRHNGSFEHDSSVAKHAGLRLCRRLLALE
jgi:hypothetical protein